MSDTLSFFIGCQIFAMTIYGIMALGTVRSQGRALQQAIALRDAGTDAFAAYLQYGLKKTRIITVVRRIGLFSLGVLSFVLIFTMSTLSFSLFDGNLSFAEKGLTILIASVLIGYLVGFFIQHMLSTALVMTRTMNAFLGCHLQSREIFARQRNALAPMLLLLAFFEGIMVTGVFFPEAFFPILFLFNLAVLVITLFSRLFAVQLYTFTACLQPLEQSQWASLAPRIREWSRLAGVEFRSVQVQRDVLAHSFGVVGIRHPMSLLGETFLRYSEWRQQDAAIALGISMVLKRVYLFRTLLALFMLVLGAVIFGGLIFLIPTQPVVISGELALLFMCAPWILFICFPLILLMILRSRRALILEADRIAASLTGNPAALVAALNTSRLLSGQRHPQIQRLENERVRNLEVWRGQQPALASYAMQPIPSIATTGLNPLAADDPVAVPASPYVSLL